MKFAPGEQRAQEAGRNGGRRSGERRRRLTLGDVERELGPLASDDDVMRWAATAFRWTAGQLIPGAAGTACASLLREWLKAHDSRLDREQIEQLEQKIAALEAELARHGRLRVERP